MSFFVDRLVEFPGRIKITDTTTGNEQVVDVERQEGNIIEPGTLLNAANMNYGTTLGQVQYDPSSAVGTVDGDLHAQLDPLGWETDVMDGPLLNVKKLFTKILRFVRAPFLVESTSTSVTLAANAAQFVTITPSKEGYTPIATVGINITGASSGSATVRQWYISGNTQKAYIHNSSTASVTWNVAFQVLYAKNS